MTRKKKAPQQASKPATRTVLDSRKGVPGHQAGGTSLLGVCTGMALCRPDGS